jgi:hypothetical protein
MAKSQPSASAPVVLAGMKPKHEGDPAELHAGIVKLIMQMLGGIAAQRAEKEQQKKGMRK